MSYCSFLTSMVLSYQSLLATGLCVQTLRLRQVVFILRDKASCSVSKHALGTGSSRFPKYEVSPATDTYFLLLFFLFICCFSYYLLLLLAGASFVQGCSSPLWSLAAPPLLSPFLQNKDLALFHCARSWITPWAVRSLPVRFTRVSKMKLGSRLPLTWLMAALTSIPRRAGLTHWSDALLQVFY